jgi:hypothetical protein
MLRHPRTTIGFCRCAMSSIIQSISWSACMSLVNEFRDHMLTLLASDRIEFTKHRGSQQFKYPNFHSSDVDRTAFSDFLSNYPAQIVVLASQVTWTNAAVIICSHFLRVIGSSSPSTVAASNSSIRTSEPCNSEFFTIAAMWTERLSVTSYLTTRLRLWSSPVRSSYAHTSCE